MKSIADVITDAFIKLARAMLRKLSAQAAAATLALAAVALLTTQDASANFMRSEIWNQQHINYGNEFTIASRAARGLGGGVVSMRITAPGTQLVINWSGVAIANGRTPGSAWILSSYHPNGDFYNAGLGHETVTVGTSANYLTSGETRHTVTQIIPLFGSGSRDPTRPDIALYYVSSGMPHFNRMNLISIENVAVDSYLEIAGFGQWGYNNQVFPRSGDIRAFVSPLDNNVAIGYDPADYRQTMTLNSDQTSFLGRGASGYSGGYVGLNGSLLGVGSYTRNGNTFAGSTGFSYLTTVRIAEINAIILRRKIISPDSISAHSSPIIPDCIAGPFETC